MANGMGDRTNLLRLPPDDEEEIYWRARHEAAHTILGIALARELVTVTVEPDLAHHPDNKGSTLWVEWDAPPAVPVDAITTWAGVVAGPTPEVAQGDLDRLTAIDGHYANYFWGALRLYRTHERDILALADELTLRRTMSGDQVLAWLRDRGWTGVSFE